jgi:spore germination cell wall hydrolase CwlJ-like protein
MNLPTIALSATLLLSSIHSAHAGAHYSTLKELQCLSAIMYSEASGEPELGKLAIAYASINRAKRSSRSTCKIKGVTRRSPPTALQPYFKTLAAKALFSKHKPIGLADSWNTGKKPHSRGKKVKVIGAHIFYVMASL